MGRPSPSTRARRWRCSPTSPWSTARGRAIRWPSCCGRSTTRSTRAARCGGRCPRCARPSGPDRLDATRDRVGLVRGQGLEVDVDRFRALAAGGRRRARAGGRPLPRRVHGGLRAARRARVRGLAARRGGRAEPRARRRAGRGWWTCARAAATAAGAIAAARRRLALDELHEPAHRRLIRLYAAERRPRRGGRAVPRVRADALARARRASAGGDDAALRGDQRGHAGAARGRAGARRRGRRGRRPARGPRGGPAAPCSPVTSRAASRCSRARPGSARRGSPRSCWPMCAEPAARCWPGAATRRRRRWPTGRWWRRCGSGCGAARSGSTPWLRTRSPRRPGCCRSSPRRARGCPRRRRSTGPARRRASSRA